jgi:hypothetical protein
MTSPELIAVIGATATVVVSMVNGFTTILTSARAKRNETHIMETKEAVIAIRANTDGINDRLIRVTGEAERAKGVLEGEKHGA